MDDSLSRRDRKKRETQLRLMEAALRLLREQGYDATTVEKIAEAADVAKGTFFNYFETKEAILPALVEWRLRQLEEALLPGKGAPASPVARIKHGLCLVAEDPLLDPALIQRLFTAIVQQRKHLPALPGLTLINLLVEQIHHAQDVGEIRADLDPIYLSGLIRALFFQHMMMWHHGNQSAPCANMIDEAVDLLMDGIAGPKWRQTS